MEPERSLPHSQVISLWIFRNKMYFYEEELLAPRPKRKLEDQPLLDVHECLFNILTVTLRTGDHSSIRNLRMRHALVTGTQLSRSMLYTVTETTAQFKIINCINPVQNPAYGHWKQWISLFGFVTDLDFVYQPNTGNFKIYISYIDLFSTHVRFQVHTLVSVTFCYIL